MANILRGLGDQTVEGTAGNDRINGFGNRYSPIPQVDTLTGKGGNDIFVLGGYWGISYKGAGNGHARITDWQVGDRFEVRDPATIGGGSYVLRPQFVQNAGGPQQDTQIFFRNIYGQEDLIAVVYDRTNLNLGRDFLYVNPPQPQEDADNVYSQPASNGIDIVRQFSLVDTRPDGSQITDTDGNLFNNSGLFQGAITNYIDVTLSNFGSAAYPSYITGNLSTSYIPDSFGGDGEIEYKITDAVNNAELVTYRFDLDLAPSSLDRTRAINDLLYIIQNNLLDQANDQFSFEGLINDRLNVQIGTVTNDNLIGGSGNGYLNGFGILPNDATQYDQLTGGAGGDIFVLGGEWGVSYFESGDGYAVITDWTPESETSVDFLADRIGVRSTQTLGGGFYSLVFKSVGGIGGSAQDTEIYYTTTGGQRDRIAIIQDTTDVDIDRDFVYSEGPDGEIIGGTWDDVIVGNNSNQRINGFGQFSSELQQFDRLTGGGGNDTFILGGDWGVSYFEEGDGYAIITDWNPFNDEIEVLSTSKLGGGFYSLEFKSVGSIGSGAQDTEIYFTTSGGYKERIAIIQDTTNVNINRDFTFV